MQRRLGKHPYIVELLDVYETPQAVVLVFELMAGELFERLVAVGPYLEHGSCHLNLLCDCCNSFDTQVMLHLTWQRRSGHHYSKACRDAPPLARTRHCAQRSQA